ncbi:MAG: hypothetical protein EOM68_08095 [Spirochaetia bacterium]|nr:hypothetical protein [Spirochaetia bacterium]
METGRAVRDLVKEIISNLQYDKTKLKHIVENFVVLAIQMRDNEDMFSDLNDPPEEPIAKFNQCKADLYEMASSLVAVPEWRWVETESLIHRLKHIMDKVEGCPCEPEDLPRF